MKTRYYVIRVRSLSCRPGRPDRRVLSFRACLMRVAFALLLGWWSPATSMGAEEGPPAEGALPAEIQTMIDRLQAAREAFRAGDFAAGEREVVAAASERTGSIATEVAEAEMLVTVCASLRNDNDTDLAGQVAGLAVGRLKRAQGKLSGREKAQALVMEGRLYERIAWDPGKAMAAYLQAAMADPESEPALRGIERLEAAEAQDLQRAAENELAALRAEQQADATRERVQP